MKTNRDNQRSKVYAWERSFPEFLGNRFPDIHAARAFVTKVRADYGLPEIHVGDGRRARNASGSELRIALPRWARARIVVLHEVAHSIAGAGAGHGPEFVRVYIDLLKRYTDLDIATIRKKATSMRIKVAKRTAVRRPMPSKTVRRLQEIEKRLGEIAREQSALWRERSDLKERARLAA